MAIDNFYRLVVHGTPRVALTFRAAIVKTVNRPTIGRVKGWRECVPLSLDAIRSRFPPVRRVAPDSLDTYEVSAWPTRRLTPRIVELRYQFQTRNCDFLDFLKPLSKNFPKLTFVLVTLSLDDCEITSCLVRDGSVKRKKLSETRRQWHWDRARQKFGLSGEAVYDDDDADYFAEQSMLDEALRHWIPVGPRSWWNRPKVRDLISELYLEAYELNLST